MTVSRRPDRPARPAAADHGHRAVPTPARSTPAAARSGAQVKLTAAECGGTSRARSAPCCSTRASTPACPGSAYHRPRQRLGAAVAVRFADRVRLPRRRLRQQLATNTNAIEVNVSRSCTRGRGLGSTARLRQRHRPPRCGGPLRAQRRRAARAGRESPSEAHRRWPLLLALGAVAPAPPRARRCPPIHHVYVIVLENESAPRRSGPPRRRPTSRRPCGRRARTSPATSAPATSATTTTSR